MKNDPHSCETIPVTSKSVGAMVEQTARRAWSSLRPPALPTVLFDTPRPAGPPSVEMASARSVRRPQPADAGASWGRAGWYTAGVLAALLAVVWVQGTPPMFTAGPESFPVRPAAAVAPRAAEGVSAAAAPDRVEAPAPAKPVAPLTLAMPASAVAASAPVAPRAVCEEESAAGRAALLRGDLSEAQAHFGAALAANASYLPAALGQADTLWALGQRAEAAAQYQAMLASYPASMIPARVTERAGNTN